MRVEKNIEMKKIIYVIVLLIGLITSACDQSTSKKNNYDSKTEAKKAEVKNVIYTKYNIPLPVELFKYMVREDVPFNIDFLNDVSNLPKYTTETKQALALGLYSAEVAYCSLYGKQQEVLEYFNCASSLASKLNIEEGFSYKNMERIENNINSADSISAIATECYWNACDFLDMNGKNNILPFVVYSGWVESQYLTIVSNNLPSTRQKIMDQKEGLHNLINYLYEVMIESTAFYYSYDIRLLILKLNNLKDVYDKVNKSGVNIDSEIYKDIIGKITAMRNEIVNQ